MNSEPSRLDHIEAIVQSNARAIEGLAAESAESRQAIAENREAIAALTQMMQVAAEERSEFRNEMLELARSQQQMAERQQQMAERQQQMAEEMTAYKRESDQRFNVLLEEVRFLIRRNNETQNGQ